MIKIFLVIMIVDLHGETTTRQFEKDSMKECVGNVYELMQADPEEMEIRSIGAGCILKFEPIEAPANNPSPDPD